MEDFLQKLKKFNKVEFLVATLLLMGALLSITSEETKVIDNYYGEIIPYSSPLARELTQAISLYLSFVLMSLFIVPKLIEKQLIQLNIGLILVVFTVLGIVWGSLDFGFMPLSAFALYSAAKFGLIYIWWRSHDLHLK